MILARKTPYYFFPCLFFPVFLLGQQVRYSSYINARSSNTFQVIGKSGEHYWAEKEQIRKIYTRHESAFVLEGQRFAVYDGRLNFIREMPALQVTGTIRQYLLTGKSFFDQLILCSATGKTKVVINRYPADNTSEIKSRLVDSFPFSAAGTRFLLVRSEDQSKALLVGFEISSDGLPRLHTILFDEGWNILYHTILEHPYFTQPCIQDDFVSFPAESFDNLPIKLANNGEWLMASESVTNLNYLLFHIYGDGKSFYYQEIPLSPYYNMEDIAMSINNADQEMSVGLLSRYGNTSLKNVQVSHYSMTQNHFDFDSTYQFNTLANRLNNQSLSNESFISIPGEGYMLFKEYGREKYPGDIAHRSEEAWDPVFLQANFSGSENEEVLQLNKNGYSLKKGLQGIRSVFDRGNLTMFYFPQQRQDSTWSGMINAGQTTELNAPTLSYLVFPAKNKVYIIYNSLIRQGNEYSTATTLNIKGQQTDDAVIFWKMDRTLDFQKARRISVDEVAVPYRNNQETGFAVIRL